MGLFKKTQLSVDQEGNVTKSEKHYSTRRDPQNYFSLYNDGLTKVLSDVKSAIELKVLLALCMNAHFGETVIPVNKAMKVKIADMIGSNIGSISNALSSLCKKGYLCNEDGNYSISINLFWKGYTDKRLALLSSGAKKSVLNNSGSEFLKKAEQSETGNFSEKVIIAE